MVGLGHALQGPTADGPGRVRHLEVVLPTVYTLKDRRQRSTCYRLPEWDGGVAEVAKEIPPEKDCSPNKEMPPRCGLRMISWKCELTAPA